MKARPTLLSTIAVSLLMLQLTFAALPRYEIIDLGPGIASGINEVGQVVGSFWSPTGELAFMWDKTTGMMDLGTLGGPWSYAIGINNAGQVTGESRTAGDENHAFLWDKTGGMIDLGTLPGYAHSRPHGINNAGQVVGDSGDTAFLWEDGKMIELGTLGSSSYARAINNIGHVVGYSYLIPRGFHAFLWDSKNGMRDLGTLAHSSWSEACGINDCGQIVGISGDHVFLSEDGEMTDLGTLWQFSVFCTINDTAQIVGTVEHYEGEYYGFYWDKRVGMIRLDELLPPDSGWRTLWRANDINNRGQIVGTGTTDSGEYRAFLMTPVPLRIYYVDDDATGANDGSSWANAYNFLQDALTDANSSSLPVEIHVAQGIYKPDRGAGITPGDREATFQLINGVTIKGGYAGLGEHDPNSRDIQLYETILSGDLDSNDIEVNDPFDLRYEPTRVENSYNVVTGSGTDASAVLDGFAITGGNANGPRQNDQDDGGGMYNDSGSPTIRNCIFSRNSSKRVGGGIFNRYGNPTVFNCTVTWNSGFTGGGMYNAHSSPMLTHCIFSRNLALLGGGGGMYNYWDSSPTMTNCNFIRNWTSGEGGGMFNSRDSYPTLINCTFNGNSAKYNGGGMYNYNNSPTVTNCIFWGDISDEIYTEGSDVSPVLTYSNVQGGWPGEGNIDADPCFVDPDGADDIFGTEDDNLRLLRNSPCIDAGDPNYVAEPNETDLDGRPRVIGGRIDMGAYETPIFAEARILPRTINLASKGRWITCYIWLPEEYDVADIEPSSVLLEQQIKAEKFSVDEQKQVATATFEREKVQSILNVGDIKLIITCQLTDGTYFEATDVIKVTDKGGGKSAK